MKMRVDQNYALACFNISSFCVIVLADGRHTL